MPQPQISEYQKERIENLSSQLKVVYGPYQLAQHIYHKSFAHESNNEKIRDVVASFYSILNVVRRHRQRLAERHLQSVM